MKIEKIITPTIYKLELNENEYLMLQALLNNTGHERENKVKDEAMVWDKKLTEEEALEIACDVETTIWDV